MRIYVTVTKYVYTVKEKEDERDDKMMRERERVSP